MLVTGLALKHCNHPNQMESYHRSYENKTNSFFKSQIWCLFLISLLIYQLLNKTFFSKVNRSARHKSVIFSLKSLKRESIFFKAKVSIGQSVPSIQIVGKHSTFGLKSIECDLRENSSQFLSVVYFQQNPKSIQFKGNRNLDETEQR